MPRSTSLTTTILNKRVLRFVDCVKIELDAGILITKQIYKLLALMVALLKHIKQDKAI